jgi:hypothetical protein
MPAKVAGSQRGERDHVSADNGATIDMRCPSFLDMNTRRAIR